MRHKVIYVYIKKLKIYINRSSADKKDIVFLYGERGRKDFKMENE
jgi:hypothetical protein